MRIVAAVLAIPRLVWAALRYVAIPCILKVPPYVHRPNGVALYVRRDDGGLLLIAQSTRTEAMMTSGSVLLLEDDAILRKLLRDILSDDGHHVQVCDSPRQVLDMAAEAPGACAVVHFWGHSHRHLADDERADLVQLSGAVPTVLMTARTWAEDEGADSLGLLALVRKPFDPDAMTTILREALEADERARIAP